MKKLATIAFTITTSLVSITVAASDTNSPNHTATTSQTVGTAPATKAGASGTAAQTTDTKTPASTARTAADEKQPVSLALPKSVKDAVDKSITAFKPSEQIDVDKPVDFPTDI